MKLHELKQKRNTIATDMRALNEKIGDNPWTDEQRTEWNKAKSELEALDERIAREEELRRQDRPTLMKTRKSSAIIRILIKTRSRTKNAARFLINGCVTAPAN